MTQEIQIVIATKDLVINLAVSMGNDFLAVDQHIDFLISLTLALIMFGIGSSLKFKGFKLTFLDPGALFLGLFLQMLLLPTIAWVIISFSGLNPDYKIGLFIVALCPGGSSSNFISYMIKANVALSISLTTINSFLILITIPILSNVAFNTFLEVKPDIILPFADTMISVFLVILMPAAAGVIFNEMFNRVSSNIQKPIRYINLTLLAMVFGFKFLFGDSRVSIDNIFNIIPYAIAIHLFSMILSYFISFKVLRKVDQANTIAIEVGLQNTTLAIMITGVLIKNSEMTKPSLIFAMFSFFTTLAFTLFATRVNAQKRLFRFKYSENR